MGTGGKSRANWGSFAWICGYRPEGDTIREPIRRTFMESNRWNPIIGGRSGGGSARQRAFGRMVRAPYSSLGDASQTGTTLCASTSWNGHWTFPATPSFQLRPRRRGE